MWRSSPSATMDGGGRLHPAELTSVVSTAIGASQVRPESADAAMYSPALLSGRTLHHTARSRVFPRAARTDDRHAPAALIDGAGDESGMNRASPAESRTRRLPPASGMTWGSLHSTGGASHAATATKTRINSGDRMARTVAPQIRFSYMRRLLAADRWTAALLRRWLASLAGPRLAAVGWRR